MGNDMVANKEKNFSIGMSTDVAAKNAGGKAVPDRAWSQRECGTV